MKKIAINIRRKDGCQDLPVPHYKTAGSSGMDLYADVENETIIDSGGIKLISAGIYLSIPEGYEAEIRPRSGLALKHGLSLVNTPGTIDSDYRGLLNLIVINHGKQGFTIRRGDRIAQMIIKEVVRAELNVVDSLDNTARQEGGFGHTGI